MFIKFVMPHLDEDRGSDTSTFEGIGYHTKQPRDRIDPGVREISPHPAKGDDLSEIRIITLERKGEESLRFLVDLRQVQAEKLFVWVMNDRGETVEKFYG